VFGLLVTIITLVVLCELVGPSSAPKFRTVAAGVNCPVKLARQDAFLPRSRDRPQRAYANEVAPLNVNIGRRPRESE
jgi:hypothetical protein